MKRAALAALLLVLTPLQARALENRELLGLVAMPLAVAAVSDVSGVPAGDLSHFVATLNRAQVPPTQFVQVVRYAPVALVVEDEQPTFIEYVDRQVDDGVVGPRLVTVIEERYRTYDLEPRFVTLNEPATTYVVREDYIPPTVVTRVTQVQPAYVVGDTNDLLGLIALPLAVAAVSELSGVPVRDLSSLVTSLNAARVPPVQVVEVLRYAPVALVSYNDPPFVQYVETQVVRGVTGPALVRVIDQRLRTYDVSPQFDLVRNRDVIVVDEDFFPPIVRTRVAEVRSHPHGGPPGQLKKELGLQTGAEVVHGTKPGRDSGGGPARVTRAPGRADDRRVVERSKPRPATGKPGKKPKVERQRVDRPNVEHAKPDHSAVHGGGKDHSQVAAGKKKDGQESGQGKGKGKGKGKG